MLHYDHRIQRIPVKDKKAVEISDHAHHVTVDESMTMLEVALWVGIPSLLLYFFALLIAI